MSVRLHAPAMLVLLATLALTGCASNPSEGYSTQSLYRGDVQTIAVPILENDTFDREVEMLLTDALIREIQERTPFRIASEATADTILTGRVRNVRLESLSRQRATGLNEELMVEMTVDFEWRDLRTDAPLVIRRDFSGSSLFVPSAPAQETIQLGQFAVVQQLARDMVDQLQAEW